MLLCNYRKCKQPLRICAVATVCKHIFCTDHNPMQLKTADGEVQCPVCRTRLNNNCELMEVDLQPCEQFRTMILMGQSPETILDVCRRAMEFYNFQKAQEIKYYEYINYKLTEKSKNMEASCKTILSNLERKNQRLQAEKEALIKECEELRDNLVVSSQKLSQLEGELRKVTINSNPECDQGRVPLDMSVDPFKARKTNVPRSDETIRSKFPRCSPDSTYTMSSPFNLRNLFSSMNFRKSSETNNIFPHLGLSSRKTTDPPNQSVRNINESFRNLSHISGKNFYR
ncbi:E3 ubiquitin-protein ligase CCNP1IP1 [Clonorchis sinensis]|nr:E3 ubiquitin-protein ligase CCNP1IP1 [Clonorchis sinensis]